MRTVLCALIAWLLAAPAPAADLFEHPQTPAQIQTMLRAAMPEPGQAQVLRGDFRQRKFLPEIPRPLISTGEFLLVRERGIWWHTRTPLDSELTLTRGSVQKQGGEIAASIFFALFALDLDTLARSFELYAMDAGSPGSKWMLGLRPRDESLAGWFQRITLAGDAQLRHITLFETTGDRTEIDLDAVAQPLSGLLPAERQRFEP